MLSNKKTINNHFFWCSPTFSVKPISNLKVTALFPMMPHSIGMDWMGYAMLKRKDWFQILKAYNTCKVQPRALFLSQRVITLHK